MAAKTKVRWRQVHVRFPEDLYNRMIRYLQGEGSHHCTINALVRSAVVDFLNRAERGALPDEISSSRQNTSGVLFDVGIIRDFCDD